MRVLVTGHVGFIGSHFCKMLLQEEPDVQIIGFNRHSHERNLRRLMGDYDWDRLAMVWGDLTDAQALSGLCEHVDVVVNFAAKTFVDHALKDRHPFIQSNIIGADNLMEDATKHGVKRFCQISSDEVYGQILEGAYKEDATLQPRNGYSWSKACADLNAIWRHRTYGFPMIITRTENNFGELQHRQKVLPTFVRTALQGDPLPVYGDGMHVRCWLHVREHCRAIWHLVKRSWDDESMLGEVYHVAGEDEMTNLALAELVLDVLDKPADQILFVPDHNIRPGHDRRYALNCDKLRATGFEIEQDLEDDLAAVIDWYASNLDWTLF